MGRMRGEISCPEQRRCNGHIGQKPGLMSYPADFFSWCSFLSSLMAVEDWILNHVFATLLWWGEASPTQHIILLATTWGNRGWYLPGWWPQMWSRPRPGALYIGRWSPTFSRIGWVVPYLVFRGKTCEWRGHNYSVVPIYVETPLSHCLSFYIHSFFSVVRKLDRGKKLQHMMV